METTTERLRELLANPGIIVMPGVSTLCQQGLSNVAVSVRPL